jgi:iron complex outermembrane receptor protein
MKNMKDRKNDPRAFGAPRGGAGRRFNAVPRVLNWSCAALVAWLSAATSLRAAEGLAPTLARADTPSLADLSLDQLVNLEVTSVSKKGTRLNRSPAAIYAVTYDDIRRSGVTSIPEALRLVPGLSVARINGSQWAISSRGFNDQYANKLLVMIDGRSIYTPTFAGVYWNAHDVVLEDLDRIEVIRGPGATLWGANAVNGVINIISKSARDTQGLLLSTLVGTEDQPNTSLRYGGRLGTNLHYRVFAKYFNREGLVDGTGRGTPDDWDVARGGVRLEWEPSEHHRLTLQGDYYRGTAREAANRVTLLPAATTPITPAGINQGGYALGRWTRKFSDRSDLALQTFYDYVQHGDADGRTFQHTYDIDLQHRFPAGQRNDIIWGAGYRFVADEIPPASTIAWTPQSKRTHLFSAFLQDEITLVEDRLHLTLGSKFEHNDYTGFEVQPSGRLLWTPTERQTVWGSASRAVRTPSRFDRDARLNVAAFQPPFSPPMLVSLFPNPNATSEQLYAYEVGYRVEPTRRVSLDLAAFYNVYHDVVTFVPGASRFEFSPPPPHLLVGPLFSQNAVSGDTYGTEVSAQWLVTDYWRLIAGYTWLHMRLRPDETLEKSSPQHQFHLRSYLDLPHGWEFNGAAHYVDEIMSFVGSTVAPIPAYVRLDLGVSWRPTRSLELGLWGQNLLDGQHPEFSSHKTTLISEVPRGVYGRVTWTY